jgi:hypothetical protein
MLLLWKGLRIMFEYEYVVSYEFDTFSVCVPLSLRVSALGDDLSVRADEVAREILGRAGMVLPFGEHFILDTNLVQVSGGYAE